MNPKVITRSPGGIAIRGRTRLDIAIGDGLMSHEICSPRITDRGTGGVILDLIKQDSWDGSLRWLDNGDFTIAIRKLDCRRPGPAASARLPRGRNFRVRRNLPAGWNL